MSRTEREALPPVVERYLATRAADSPWQVEGVEAGGFVGAVVIPALAEEESLGATLAALAANPPGLLERFLVLVVVNHREDAETSVREENRRTLERLREGGWSFPGLRLAWIDAASPGRELPLRRGGVGLARKIGLDLAFTRLDFRSGEPLLLCLDADTLVDTGYLSAVVDHFARRAEGGAVIPFCHRPGRTAAEDRAIRRYELYQRSYVLGLSLAGSPYAFHTVGSTIACRALSYVGAGGMNHRAAGEDFYFLQQLAKTSGVASLSGTVVRPSPRPSRRTPFGTGRSVERLMGGETDAVRFYPASVFCILRAWLELAERGGRFSAGQMMERAGALSEALADALREFGFAARWSRLQRNHTRADGLTRAFHGWFDALRTQQVIRRLGDSAPPVDAAAVEELLRWGGFGRTEEEEEQLILLRGLQGVEIGPESL